MKPQYLLAFIALALISATLSWAESREDQYDQLIMKAAMHYRVSPTLIKAVIKVESNFDPYAISPKAHAMGLMQIIPENFRTMGLSNPFDPEQNIMAGTRMLSEHMWRFRGSMRSSLIAYNAGKGAAVKALLLKHYALPAETRNYLEKVRRWYIRYRGINWP